MGVEFVLVDPWDKRHAENLFWLKFSHDQPFRYSPGLTHLYIGQKIFRVNIKIDPVYIVTYGLIVIDSSLHLTIKNTFVFVILQISMKWKFKSLKF